VDLLRLQHAETAHNGLVSCHIIMGGDIIVVGRG
jgi:hypothetical protein